MVTPGEMLISWTTRVKTVTSTAPLSQWSRRLALHLAYTKDFRDVQWNSDQVTVRTQNGEIKSVVKTSHKSESRFNDMQMNTPLFRERRIDLLRRVRPALHPIVWVDEGADLNDENASKLKKMIVLPSIALKVDLLSFVCIRSAQFG